MIIVKHQFITIIFYVSQILRVTPLMDDLLTLSGHINSSLLEQIS